jgi:hypothetical protein
MTLTHSGLVKLLNYDPGTGLFTWRVAVGTRARPGDFAGHLKSDGYWVIKIGGVGYRAHRLAWLFMVGEWPEHVVDHINGSTADNRWENLRACTQGENVRNQCRARDNSSGFKGVSYCRGKWQAQIMAGGKQHYLGLFDSPEIAHAAYVAASGRLHGNFARAQ